MRRKHHHYFSGEDDLEWLKGFSLRTNAMLPRSRKSCCADRRSIVHCSHEFLHQTRVILGYLFTACFVLLHSSHVSTGSRVAELLESDNRYGPLTGCLHDIFDRQSSDRGLWFVMRNCTVTQDIANALVHLWSDHRNVTAGVGFTFQNTTLVNATFRFASLQNHSESLVRVGGIHLEFVDGSILANGTRFFFSGMKVGKAATDTLVTNVRVVLNRATLAGACFFKFDADVIRHVSLRVSNESKIFIGPLNLFDVSAKSLVENVSCTVTSVVHEIVWVDESIVNHRHDDERPFLGWFSARQAAVTSAVQGAVVSVSNSPVVTLFSVIIDNVTSTRRLGGGDGGARMQHVDSMLVHVRGDHLSNFSICVVRSVIRMYVNASTPDSDYRSALFATFALDMSGAIDFLVSDVVMYMELVHSQDGTNSNAYLGLLQRDGLPPVVWHNVTLTFTMHRSAVSLASGFRAVVWSVEATDASDSDVVVELANISVALKVFGNCRPMTMKDVQSAATGGQVNHRATTLREASVINMGQFVKCRRLSVLTAATSAYVTVRSVIVVGYTTATEQALFNNLLAMSLSAVISVQNVTSLYIYARDVDFVVIVSSSVDLASQYQQRATAVHPSVTTEPSSIFLSHAFLTAIAVVTSGFTVERAHVEVLNGSLIRSSAVPVAPVYQPALKAILALWNVPVTKFNGCGVLATPVFGVVLSLGCCTAPLKESSGTENDALHVALDDIRITTRDAYNHSGNLNSVGGGQWIAPLLIGDAATAFTMQGVLLDVHQQLLRFMFPLDTAFLPQILNDDVSTTTVNRRRGSAVDASKLVPIAVAGSDHRRIELRVQRCTVNIAANSESILDNMESVAARFLVTSGILLCRTYVAAKTDSSPVIQVQQSALMFFTQETVSTTLCSRSFSTSSRGSPPLLSVAVVLVSTTLLSVALHVLDISVANVPMHMPLMHLAGASVLSQGHVVIANISILDVGSACGVSPSVLGPEVAMPVLRRQWHACQYGYHIGSEASLLAQGLSSNDFASRELQWVIVAVRVTFATDSGRSAADGALQVAMSSSSWFPALCNNTLPATRRVGCLDWSRADLAQPSLRLHCSVWRHRGFRLASLNAPAVALTSPMQPGSDDELTSELASRYCSSSLFAAARGFTATASLPLPDDEEPALQTVLDTAKAAASSTAAFASAALSAVGATTGGLGDVQALAGMLDSTCFTVRSPSQTGGGNGGGLAYALSPLRDFGDVASLWGNIAIIAAVFVAQWIAVSYLMRENAAKTSSDFSHDAGRCVPSVRHALESSFASKVQFPNLSLQVAFVLSPGVARGATKVISVAIWQETRNIATSSSSTPMWVSLLLGALGFVWLGASFWWMHSILCDASLGAQLQFHSANYHHRIAKAAQRMQHVKQSAKKGSEGLHRALRPDVDRPVSWIHRELVTVVNCLPGPVIRYGLPDGQWEPASLRRRCGKLCGDATEKTKRYWYVMPLVACCTQIPTALPLTSSSQCTAAFSFLLCVPLGVLLFYVCRWPPCRSTLSSALRFTSMVTLSLTTVLMLLLFNGLDVSSELSVVCVVHSAVALLSTLHSVVVLGVEWVLARHDPQPDVVHNPTASPLSTESTEAMRAHDATGGATSLKATDADVPSPLLSEMDLWTVPESTLLQLQTARAKALMLYRDGRQLCDESFLSDATSGSIIYKKKKNGLDAPESCGLQSDKCCLPPGLPLCVAPRLSLDALVVLGQVIEHICIVRLADQRVVLL